MRRSAARAGRRVAGLATLLTVLLGSVALDAVPSAAAPSGAAACAQRPYPADAGAQLQLRSSRARAGRSLVVAGTGFCPNEAVHLVVQGRPVVTLRTDGTGTLAPVTVDLTRSGPTRVCAERPAGAGAGPCGEVVVAAAPGAARRTSPALTGVEVAALVALAALLLASGIAFATAGRRRAVPAPG